MFFYDTERLLLRPLEAGDARQLSEFFVRNKNFLSRWEPARDGSYYSEQGVNDLIEKHDEEMRKRAAIYLYIFLKKDQRLIGSISVSNIIYGYFQSCFLSYKLDERELHKGYMTEGLKKTIEICFTEYKLHRIEANVIPDNAASIRILQRLRFSEEGRSQKYLKINGRWQDHIHFVLLNETIA